MSHNVLIDALDAVKSSSFANDEERYSTIFAARALLSRIETPFEQLRTIAFDQPATAAALKIGHDLSLFQKWSEDPVAKTPAQLAAATGSATELLARLLRHLASNNYLKEITTGLYEPTPLSLSLPDPTFNCWIRFHTELTAASFLHLPEYLAKHNYVPPTDPRDGIPQQPAVYDCQGQTLFEWYGTHPQYASTFNNIMTGFGATRTAWLDIYPSKSLLNGWDQLSPLLVDIGGNVGHDLDKFAAKHPGTASNLVLQDLPDVIENALCDTAIQRRSHDFFTEQSVKGARAYYFHNVFHDWNDELSTKILVALRGALKKGYSRLLIDECIITDEKASRHVTALDVAMMAFVSGKERSEADWKSLIEGAGYKIINIWKKYGAPDGLIECEVA